MEYTTENGDTVEFRGLTIKVELGEKTRNEIVSRAMARMQEATETIERLTQALVEADAENAKLRELCGDLMGWIAFTTMGERVPLDAYCALEDRMSALGIEVRE